MNITVLGSQGPYPGPNGACSGYLIEDEKSNILLDCGSGILSRYQKYYDLIQLKNIILSHLHSDHMTDMLVLRYAADIMLKNKILTEPINVFCPKTPEKVYEELFFNNVFNVKPIENNLEISLNGFKILFRKMVHPVETYAVKFIKENKIFVYSGDTVYNSDLIEFSKEADILLCDGNLLNDENGPHLTAAQAAEIAQKAKCKKLIITHLNPAKPTELYYDEAREIFDNVIIAKDFETYVL